MLVRSAESDTLVLSSALRTAVENGIDAKDTNPIRRSFENMIAIGFNQTAVVLVTVIILRQGFTSKT